ncbi:MAG: hypothetical protein JXM73_25950 [Anaerolineae bacterium]|nr:hypothetical protein [Anaerolineae bacterium]
MIFASFYAILVGIGMIGQWGFSLATRRVPEIATEPFRISFHLAGEFLTAATLIAAGLGLLTGASWGRPAFLVALGMLLYTIVVSPGYFAQRREWPMVGMFAVLFVLALLSLALVL